MLESYWQQIFPYYDPRVVIYDRKLLYKIGHWFEDKKVDQWPQGQFKVWHILCLAYLVFWLI